MGDILDGESGKGHPMGSPSEHRPTGALGLVGSLAVGVVASGSDLGGTLAVTLGALALAGLALGMFSRTG